MRALVLLLALAGGLRPPGTPLEAFLKPWEAQCASQGGGSTSAGASAVPPLVSGIGGGGGEGGPGGDSRGAAPGARARWLGTIPAYPGATRPFRALERTDRIVALTPDAPGPVMAFYRERLSLEGWTLDANASELDGPPDLPRWTTWRRPGYGVLTLAAATGTHPETGRRMTVLTVSTDLKP